MTNKELQSTIADHRLASPAILSTKNECAQYVDYQFATADSAALEAQSQFWILMIILYYSNGIHFVSCVTYSSVYL